MQTEITRIGCAGYGDFVPVDSSEAMDVIAGHARHDTNLWRRGDYVRELGMWDFFTDMPEAALHEICRQIALDGGVTMPSAYGHMAHLIEEITSRN